MSAQNGGKRLAFQLSGHIYVNCNAKDPTGRTRFWLEKAQSSLLSVIIDVRDDTSHISDVMELLLDHISQWQSFTINSVLLSHSNYLLSFCGSAAPELRLVNITVTQEFDDNDNGNQPEAGDGDGRQELVELMASFPEAPRFSTLQISCNTRHHLGLFPLPSPYL